MAADLLCLETFDSPPRRSIRDPVILNDARVLRNLLEVDERHTPSTSYFNIQTDLNPFMRKTLTRWMLEVTLLMALWNLHHVLGWKVRVTLSPSSLAQSMPCRVQFSGRRAGLSSPSLASTSIICRVRFVGARVGVIYQTPYPRGTISRERGWCNLLLTEKRVRHPQRTISRGKDRRLHRVGPIRFFWPLCQPTALPFIPTTP